MADQKSGATSLSDEEEFHDAVDEESPTNPESPHHSTPASGDIDTARGIVAMETAMDMMNRNLFQEAIRMLKPKASSCMYHSMAYSSVLFLKAGFCMDPESIEGACAELNRTIALCSSHRKAVGMVSSLSNWWFGNARMDNHTTLELHAEIYHAEANLLLSFLTFLQDESLMSFVRGGFRIRSCYTLYKQLYGWLTTCQNHGVTLDPNFTTGVRMGMGSFNLFLSLVPARILKVLEFVGFSGDRELGIRELERGATSSTFRAPICSAFLLFFHTMLTIILGVSEPDPDYADSLLTPNLHKYPQSVLFLYFKGRVALLRGKIDTAITNFHDAMGVQDQWKQVHHMCWWELMWCSCARLDWKEVYKYADLLFMNSKWSKAMFLYIKSCCRLMLREEPVDREEIKKLMKEFPSHRQKIAGKNLPIEKFAAQKCDRFLKGARLPLPMLEVLYAYNFYLLLKENQPLLKNFMKLVWMELVELETKKETNIYYVDDFCVVTMLQGVIFKAMSCVDEAMKCFNDVIERADDVQYDIYCLPAAMLELGLLYIDMGRLDEAQRALETAKTKYKGYVLENRMQFRAHAAQYRIARLKSTIQS